MSTIFDITNSKGFIFNNRSFFNDLAINSVELLDDLLVLIEGTKLI